MSSHATNHTVNANLFFWIYVRSLMQRQHQLPTNPRTAGKDLVAPLSSVCDLSIHLDADLIMQTYVAKAAAICFAVLRQIRSIHRSVSPAVFQYLISSLLVSLRLLHSAWFASSVTRKAPVNAKCRRMADICTSSEQPRDTTALQSALAAGA